MIEPFEGINKMSPGKKEEYARELKEVQKNRNTYSKSCFFEEWRQKILSLTGLN